MLLAALMIPVMYLTAVWQVARANQPPFTDPLTWTIVPLAVIIPFAIMVWNGWSELPPPAQWHKCSMLSASIPSVMGPSIARLPIAPPNPSRLHDHLHVLGLALFIPDCSSSTTARSSARSIRRRSWGSRWPRSRRNPRLAIVFWSGLDWAAWRRTFRRRRLGRSRFRHCRDQLQRFVGRQRRAFLPGRLVAQMLAGEDDRSFRLQQLGIGRSPTRAAAAGARIEIGPQRADAFGIWGEAPGDGHPFGQKVRFAGVQRLDRLPADAEALLVARLRSGPDCPGWSSPRNTRRRSPRSVSRCPARGK